MSDAPRMRMKVITRDQFANAINLIEEGPKLKFVAEASTLGFFAVDQLRILFAFSTKIFELKNIESNEQQNEWLAAHYIEHATGDTLVIFND